MADMEKVLLVWIKAQTSHNIPLNQSLNQSMVLTLFNSMKAERGEEAAEEKLKASRDLHVRFQEGSRLHNIKVQGEATSADAEAKASYPKDLAKTINEGGCTKQQSFQCRADRLTCKKMPPWTFLTGEENSMSGFKASKSKLTFILGADAAGDFQ